MYVWTVGAGVSRQSGELTEVGPPSTMARQPAPTSTFPGVDALAVIRAVVAGRRSRTGRQHAPTPRRNTIVARSGLLTRRSRTPMPSLFDPLTIGAIQAPNRVVMAPLTRNRAAAELRAGH